MSCRVCLGVFSLDAVFAYVVQQPDGPEMGIFGSDEDAISRSTAQHRVGKNWRRRG